MSPQDGRRSEVPKLEEKRDDLPTDIHNTTIQDQVDGQRTRDHAENSRQLLSPIQKLPSETLLEIFLLSCRQNRLLPPTQDRRHMCPTLALSTVCSSWRSIILSFSKLWASIKIDFGLVWPRELLPLLSKQAQIFMERSKSALLSLDLSFNMFRWDKDMIADIVPIWNTLVAHSKRWSRVRLDVMDFNLLGEALFTPLMGRLDSLKHLSIDPTTVGLDPPPLVIDLFEVCPSLDHVDLGFSQLDLVVLPYSQIRSLTVGPDAGKFLPLFDNVEQLVLQGCGIPDDLDNLEQHPYRSSKVQSLTVEVEQSDSDFSETHFSNVFRMLTLEGLSSLEITGGVPLHSIESWETFDSDSVAVFLRQSCCTITNLVLKWTPISDVQVIDLIRLTPALRRLHIEECRYGRIERNGVPTNATLTERFFEALDLRLGGTPFVPCLNELGLVFHWQDWDLIKAFRRAMYSRMSPQSNVITVPPAARLSVVALHIIKPEEVQ